MGEIKGTGITLSAEQHLVSGERMLASCGRFHLTDRRLLKYEGSRMLFLPIDRITTVNPTTVYLKPAVMGGGILVGMGILAKVFAIIGDAMSESMSGMLGGEYNPPNYSAMVNPIFLGLLVVGIVILGAGIAFKRDWYQISAAGLTGEDTKVWRIPRDDSIEARNFIRVLETRMAGGGFEREVPTAAAAPPAEKIEPRPKASPEVIEERVYHYIRGRRGEIDVGKCAEELGFSVDEVEAAIGALEKKIKLERE